MPAPEPGGDMRRREFIAGLGGIAAVVGPRGAWAQQPKRIGMLMNAAATEKAPQAFVAAFVDALGQKGWIEGQNIRIDVRWNAGNADLARTYAAQIIGL